MKNNSIIVTHFDANTWDRVQLRNLSIDK